MEAIKVTLEPVNARSDLHMLLCSDFIFNRRLDIMEKYIIREIANNKGKHAAMNSNELAKMTQSLHSATPFCYGVCGGCFCRFCGF